MVERGTHKPQKMVQFHPSAPEKDCVNVKFLLSCSVRGRSSTVEHSPVTGEAVGSAPIARAIKAAFERLFAWAKQANDFACVGVLTGGTRFFHQKK